MESFNVGNVKFTLAITIGTAKKIRAQTDIDLTIKDVGVLFKDMWAKPLQRMQMIWLALTDDCRGELAEDDFYDLLQGDILRDADATLWREVQNFIQSLDVTASGVVEAMMKNMEALSGQQAKLITELVESVDSAGMMTQLVEKARQTALDSIGKMSLESLDGSNSTHIHSPSEN